MYSLELVLYDINLGEYNERKIRRISQSEYYYLSDS